MIRFAKMFKGLNHRQQYWHIVSKRNVQITFKDDLLVLTFPFIMGSKMFFAHSQYSFLTLQEQLQLEESTKVEFNLDGTDLSLSSNLFNYILNDKKNKAIKMLIQDEEFTVTPAYQLSEAKMLNQQTQLKHSPQKRYIQMVNMGMDPSHANTLSWFLNSCNIQQNLTEKEIVQVMEQGLSILKQPTKDKLYELQHLINILEAEICKQRQQLDVMIGQAEQTGYRWLTLLFVLSVLQIGAFYYGIYMVDEWGWNVCEPFTYTFQCVTVLLGMIFYVRYRRQREIESIRWAFMFRKQIKERNWKDRWNHLNTLISLKEEQKRGLELRKTILYNRMNYHYYVQQQKK
ncbi:unnamed protein product [Paramecium octaurelia]|uniref:Calcium uniporter protein n=1 Tax=Paramecium octaurelia TaxID=43137 RepID=A0A8S1SYD6_PAROT|nr:unnamed protein product [Paramecium octaurelia]